jgi:glycosyltransferase involved in cell wall biosynthesis
MGYSFLLLADAITVPTNCFAAKIPFKKSFNKNKIHLIGSPIDVNKFYPKTSQNSTSPSDKNPKNNNRKKTSKIMYYGALTVHKGANLLFEIIPLVIAKKPNTHFYIFPRHTNIDHWREKAKTAGIDQYCTFNTNEVDIAQEVRNSDLIILPYVNLRGTDGNPSCLLEAMTCEVPIVTANLPELVEITQNTVALSVPHPQAFASQILSSLDHYHSQNLKDAAKLAQNYAAPSIAKQLDNLYKDL